MTKYVCNRCSKIFLLKGDYTRHLKRKNPCEKIECEIENNTFEINDKDKIYEKNDMKSEIKDNTFINLLFDKLDKMQNKMDNMQEKIDDLSDENKILREKVEYVEMSIKDSLNTVNNTVNSNNTINNNTVNVNINLKSHGKEDYEFITENVWKKILDGGFGSIYKLIEYVHFNKDKPEYHNVYMPSKKQNMYVMVYNGNKWKLVNKKDIISTLKENGIGFIEGKFDELNNENKLTEKAKKGMRNFLKEYNNNCNIENENDNIIKKKLDSQIEKEIELILYNNKDIVMETIDIIKKNKQKKEI
jgi:DNA-directed RNA polymerase subunit RPC12/RpoP